MSDIVKKGDFLVFTNVLGQVTEFFISTREFDLNTYTIGSIGRRLVKNCFGFRMADNHFYEEGWSYCITRKATPVEEQLFYELIERYGFKFNLNNGVTRW